MVALNYGNFVAATGGISATSSGPILWVDPVNGNDADALVGIQYGVAPNATPFRTIDAANAAAAALTQLSPPTFPSTVFTGASSTGGSLNQSSTNYYKITALSGQGETTASAEQSYTTPAGGTSTNQITINWNAVPGASGYNIYRGGSGSENILGSVPAGVTSFADTGFSDYLTVPTTNTTAAALIQLTAGYFVQGAITGGDLQLTPGVWLNGMGDSTVIVFANQVGINPGTNCTISNLRIFAPQNSDTGMLPLGGTSVGHAGNDQAGDNVNFWNVHIQGGSDCIYLSKGTGVYPSMTWKFFSCLFESLFDTTNVLDAQSGTAWPLTLNFYGCRFICTADGNGNLTRCLCITSGNGITYNVYGGSATCIGGSGGTAVVSVAGTSNAINLYGVALVTTSSGGTQNSIKVGSGCKVHVGAGCDFDPSLISNSGTLTGQAQILGNSGTSVSASTGAGSGATVSLATNSDDSHGQISIVTAGTPSASSTVATVTFGAAKHASFPVLTPANASAQALSGNSALAVGSSSGTSFTITSGSTALTTGTTYLFNYTA